jgi:hypothetical protein
VACMACSTLCQSPLHSAGKCHRMQTAHLLPVRGSLEAQSARVLDRSSTQAWSASRAEREQRQVARLRTKAWASKLHCCWKHWRHGVRVTAVMMVLALTQAALHTAHMTNRKQACGGERCSYDFAPTMPLFVSPRPAGMGSPHNAAADA